MSDTPNWLRGSLLLGWGLFNLGEGVINHHILGIHHLRDDLGGPLAWDLGVLAFGGLLALSGWGVIRFGERASGRSMKRISTSDV